MADTHPKTSPINSLLLPLNVVSRTDVSRMLRELLSLEEFLASSSIRKPGTQPKLPKTSKLLDETFELNKLNPLVEAERASLKQFLTEIHDKGPSLHMSFSVDPSPIFTKKLMTWLRQNIQPNLLLQVGLQPDLGAGCVVRTQNKYFDFSLRRTMVEKRPLLLERLSGAEKTS